jgi:hypothetical protein
MAFESIVPTPVSPKTLAALVFSACSHAQAHWRRGTNAFRRQILPTSLPGINHTGSGSRYSGTDLSGGINRNVMGRTEPHLRQHRQSPADRRRFVHRQRRRLTPKCSVNWIFAGHFDCRCVDRSSRGGRSEGAQETGPRQRPQRIRRILDTLKLGLLDGSVDQSTLARLKVASEGLTERSGDAGLDTVPRRNRPACCGRAGEGWGPLDPRHKFRKSESPEVIEQSPESGLP